MRKEKIAIYSVYIKEVPKYYNNAGVKKYIHRNRIDEKKVAITKLFDNRLNNSQNAIGNVRKILVNVFSMGN